MAIQSSGVIALSDIQDEFGGTNPIGLSEYYRGGAYTTSNNTSVPTSGAISLSNFYGGTARFAFTISSNTKEANLATLATAAGWDGVSPLVATVGSGVYLWSDNTSVGGLTVPNSITTSVTIYNNGYIIGRGGDGGYTTGQDGGPALVNLASNVSVVNNSGAYIAGGGGGGGGNGASGTYRGGGAGGAGGGNGSNMPLEITTIPLGGAIGQAGQNGIIYRSDGASGGSNLQALGGGAGGGGGSFSDGSSAYWISTSAGGGRILPGTGGTASNPTPNDAVNLSGGDGGSGGSAGGNASYGGGGGWGAAGGNGAAGNGGAGGAAISGAAVTLTNNGTIYGSVV